MIFPCWHNWSKWKVTVEGPLVERLKDGSTANVGSYVTQKRECSRCGKIEIRDSRS